MKKTFTISPKFRIFCILCTLFAANSSFLINNSSAQSISWQRLYRPTQNGEEAGYDLCQGDGSSLYLVGFTANPLRKGYVLKISQDGDTIWTRIFEYVQETYSVVETNDSGCIFAGFSGQAFACRLRPNGDSLWLKYYSGSSVLKIIHTRDGNYILCGSIQIGGTTNGYICKIDSSGNVIWEKNYIAPFALFFSSIKLAIGNGYIVCGEKYDSNNGPRNGYLAKINDTGSIEWEKIYSLSAGITKVKDIATNNQGYVVFGSTSNFIFVMKTNLNGDSTHTNLYNTSNNMDIYYLSSVLKQSDDKYYCSYTSGPASTVFSIDSNLNIIKQVVLQPQENTLTVSSIMFASGFAFSDIICSGTSDALSQGDLDVYACRLDSALIQPPPIGIKTNSNSVPRSIVLYQNFPNPFNPETRIKLDIHKKGNIGLKVYDLLGKEIANLIENFLPMGTYEINFYGIGLSSGIYFYQLTVDGVVIDSKKMCLLR